MLDLFDGPAAAQHTLRFLEEKCQAGVFSWNIKTGEMQWSPGAYVLLGIPPGSVNPSYSLFVSMMHPQDRPGQDELDLFIENGLPFAREFRIIQHDGRMRWLSHHSEFILDPSGAATRMVGVVTDVSGKHEANKSLMATQERFRDLVMGVAPIIWVADSDGMIRGQVGWTSVTGRSDSSALGMEWIEALHPDDSKGTLAAWRTAVERGHFFQAEFRLAQGCGGYRWYRAYGVPTQSREGAVREWNGLTVDIRAEAVASEQAAAPVATGAQIRASRAILKWSVGDLCEASGISPAIIRRLEDFDGPAPKSAAPAEAIRRAIVAAGVELIFTPDGKPGVRPATGSSSTNIDCAVTQI